MASSITRALKGDAPYIRGDLFRCSRGGFLNYKTTVVNPSADLMVCIHGLNASIAQYDLFAKIFSSLGFNVLRVDLFGHGLSSAVNCPDSVLDDCLESLRELVAYVVDEEIYVPNTLLKHADFTPGVPIMVPSPSYPSTRASDKSSDSTPSTKITLIGFSMGGYLAVEFHNRFPHWVKKVVLLSPAGLIREKSRSIRLIQNRYVGSAVTAVCEGAFWLMQLIAVNGRKMREFYSQPTREDMDLNARDWKHISRRNLRNAMLYARCLQLWNNEEAFIKLAEHGTEVLFCWGSADKTTPYNDYQCLLTQLFPDLEQTVFENCGHLILQDAVPDVYRRIYTFVTLDQAPAIPSVMCPSTPRSLPLLSTCSFGSTVTRGGGPSLLEFMASPSPGPLDDGDEGLDKLCSAISCAPPAAGRDLRKDVSSSTDTGLQPGPFPLNRTPMARHESGGESIVSSNVQRLICQFELSTSASVCRGNVS